MRVAAAIVVYILAAALQSPLAIAVLAAALAAAAYPAPGRVARRGRRWQPAGDIRRFDVVE